MTDKDINFKIDAVFTNAKAKEVFDTLLAVENRQMTPVEIVELVYKAIFEKKEEKE